MFRRLIAIAAIVGLAVAFAVSRRGNRGQVVETAEVAVAPRFRSFVTASGEVVARRYADIGASVMGRVVALRVKEGDRVRRGQILARLDAARAAAEVDGANASVRALSDDRRAAEARLSEAKLTADRNDALFNQGLLPAAQRDASRASKEAAEAQLGAIQNRIQQAGAQLRSAKDALEKTEVVAPIDGVVTRLQVREGEMVVIGLQNQPGTVLMRLVDTSGVNAELKVAEADALRLAVGQTARVTLDALPGREFTGRVAEVGASSLPPFSAQAASAREFRVVIELDTNDAELRPGLSCDAEVLVAERANALTAPLQAVVAREREGRDITGVFAIDASDGQAKAEFRYVEIGLTSGLDVEIMGVPAGTEVISGPLAVLRSLKDGDAVRRR